MRRSILTSMLAVEAVVLAILWWSRLVPWPVSVYLDAVVNTLPTVAALPIVLLTNRWLSHHDMTAITVMTWAGTGAVVGYLRHRFRSRFTPRASRTPAYWAFTGGIWVTGSVIIMFCLWLLFGLLGFIGSALGRPALQSLTSPDLWAISELTSVNFPRNTDLLYSAQTHWQNTDISAKLMMDRHDVEKLIASMPQGAEVSREDRFGLSGPSGKAGSEMPWWDGVGSVRDFVAVRHDGKRSHVAMLVSLDDPDRAVVYLFWHD